MKCKDPLLTLFLLLGACSGKERPNNPWALRELKLEAYESCSALVDDLAKRNQFREEWESSWDDGPIPLNSENRANGSASNGTPPTNLQDDKILESDRLQANADEAYFSAGSSVFRVRGGAAPEELLSFSQAKSVELILEGDRLNVLVGTYDETQWFLYKIQSDGTLSKISEQSWKGRLQESRLKNGRIVMLLSEGFPEIMGEEVVIENNTKFHGIACTKTLRPITGDFDGNIQKLVVVDADGAHVQELQFLGLSSELYASEENLYLSHSFLGLQSWTEKMDWDLTALIQVPWSVSADSLSVRASALIAGQLLSRYSLREYVSPNGPVLASLTSLDWQSDHQLRVMRASQLSLDTIKMIDGFGKGESVRSVLFSEDRAHVVTYKEVDPLFSFDFTNPEAPQLTGELKVPGFSLFMRALSSTRLLGIGRADTNSSQNAGLQVSVFDTSGAQANEVVRKTFGKSGSYADVFYDPRVFFHDAKNGVLAFSAVLYGNSSHSRYAGLLVLDDNLNLLTKISHESYDPDEVFMSSFVSTSPSPIYDGRAHSSEQPRFFRLDDRYYSVSQWALLEHDLQDPSVVKATHLLD